MLIHLVDALKEVLRLSDTEMAKRLDTSVSTLVKHRAHPEADFSPKVAGKICDYFETVVEKEFPTMTPEKRLLIWRKASNVMIELRKQLAAMSAAERDLHAQRDVNITVLAGTSKRIWKRYIHDGENVHPDWL